MHTAPAGGRPRVTSTATLPDADLLLCPLDPGRGFRSLSSHIEKLAEDSPKLGEACELLEEHLSGLEPADLDEVFAPLLWLLVRDTCTSPPWLVAISRWLADGERTLAAVQAALVSTFNPRVLQQVTHEARDWEAAQDAADTPLSAARRQWRAIVDSSGDNLAPLAIAGAAFVAGAAIAVAVEEMVHHHHTEAGRD